MKATKTVVVLVLMFLLAWGAGVVTGKLTFGAAAAPPPAPPPPRPSDGSLLSEELQLDAPQREQMRPIWEAVRDTARDCAAQAQAVQRAHDEQLVAILNDEQKARYARLNDETRRKVDALDARRKEAFRQAVERTEKILREDQRQAYERIIQNRLGALPGGGAGSGAATGQ